MSRARGIPDRDLALLVARASDLGVPARVADEAARAVARASRSEAAPFARSRAEAYFWGVVRRRALRGEAPRFNRLLLAASLASELLEAGHSAASAADEVARVYGVDVAPDVIGRAMRPSGRAA